MGNLHGLHCCHLKFLKDKGCNRPLCITGDFYIRFASFASQKAAAIGTARNIQKSSLFVHWFSSPAINSKERNPILK